jgi:antitoxin ParD1/3/4
MNISVSLTPELSNLIKDKVESGRYASTSEVVREALRLLERAEREESERIKALRRAWREGIESGDAGELDFAKLGDAARGELVVRKRRTQRR